MKASWQITNGTLCSADAIQARSGLTIRDGRIGEILSGPDTDHGDTLTLNLHGLAVLPGLINGHDSLLASYRAPTPRGAPFLNWLAWDNELKTSKEFQERMLLEVSDLYTLGAYRNALAGVSFVVDHIPHFVREPYQDDLVVPLLPDYGISHSLCSYSLDWGRGARREYEYAREKGLPYITHIAEGSDPESRSSLRRLDDAGALGPHSVLVHGIALDESDLDLIAHAGAHLVWCPASNLRLYGKTLPVREALERHISVCLGSDAAMFGSQNLLEDLRQAREFYQKHYGAELAPEDLLRMVTSAPAAAFRVSDRGTLKPGNRADFVVLSGEVGEGLETIFDTLSPAQIYLVVIDGKPVYAEEALEPLFTAMGLLFDRVNAGGKPKLIQKGLREVLERVSKATGQTELSFVPVTL